MSRVDYGRVERLLVKGLRKIFIERLQERAARASVMGSEQRTTSEQEVDVVDRDEAHAHMLGAVQYNLRRLMKRDKELHEHLGLSRQELSRLVEEPRALTVEDWERLRDLKTDIDARSHELQEQFEPDGVDEDLVGAERAKHKYLRFNVRPGWIPLDTHAPPPEKKKRSPGRWDELEE